jgi:hypothetical protein
MLHATIEVARRVERAEIEFCALAGATRRAVAVLEAGGGRALFSRPGSPLNKVLGLGLQGRVTDEDLNRIETFYKGRKAPTQIELCPLAYGDLAARLCARGYVLEAFENELAKVLRPADPAPGEHADRSDAQSAGGGEFNRRGQDGPVGADAGRPISITLATAAEDDLWTRVVSEGFVAFEPLVGGAPEAAPMTVEQMAEMMSQFAHPKISRYIAWIDGEPAGAGAAWAYEGVLGIFGTSTLTRFRRRGVQAAIATQALDDARGSADLAIATTSPGSTSQRTFERLGFQVLYTRAVFLKS